MKQGEAVSVVVEETLKTAEKTEDEKDKQEEEKEPVVFLDTEDVTVICNSKEASLVNSIVSAL